MIRYISHKMKILSKLLSKPFWSNFAMQEMTFGSLKVLSIIFFGISSLNTDAHAELTKIKFIFLSDIFSTFVFFSSEIYGQRSCLCHLIEIITPVWSNLDLSNKICVLWLLSTHGPVIDRFGHPGGIMVLVPGGIFTLQSWTPTLITILVYQWHLQNLKNITDSVTQSPIWIQEMLAHLKIKDHI